MYIWRFLEMECKKELSLSNKFCTSKKKIYFNFMEVGNNLQIVYIYVIGINIAHSKRGYFFIFVTQWKTIYKIICNK